MVLLVDVIRLVAFVGVPLLCLFLALKPIFIPIGGGIIEITADAFVLYLNSPPEAENRLPHGLARSEGATFFLPPFLNFGRHVFVVIAIAVGFVPNVDTIKATVGRYPQFSLPGQSQKRVYL